MKKLLSLAVTLIVAGCATTPLKSGENNANEQSPEAAKEYRVTIPEEKFTVVEFQQFSSPGIATINTSLVDFEPKEVFSWHLSILIEIDGVAQNGMPTQEEQDVLYAVEDSMAPSITSDGNALFLARVTYDGQRELIYRVYNPEPTHEYLAKVIESGNYERAFEYRLEPDQNWEKASWYLNSAAR